MIKRFATCNTLRRVTEGVLSMPHQTCTFQKHDICSSSNLIFFIFFFNFIKQQHIEHKQTKKQNLSENQSKFSSVTNIFKYNQLKLKDQNIICCKLFWLTGGYVTFLYKSSYGLNPNTLNLIVSRNYYLHV